MTKNELLALLRDKKSEFVDRYHISKLGLFGSYARGDNNASSDADILFEVEDGAKFSLFKYLELAKKLEDELHCKVDLVREATLKKELKPIVYKDLIYV